MAKLQPFLMPGIRACLMLAALAGARQAAADFIDLHFTGSDANKAVFDQAKAFWESKLTGFVTPGDAHRLVINASVVSIDGAGGILGSSSPGGLTTIGGFVYSTTGTMRFDSADYPGTIDLDVVEHEMAHVLGIGTLWDSNHLYVDGSGQYTGQYALAAWRAEFNQPDATFVPVELGGGPGTADGHWNEVDGGAGNTGFVSNIGGQDFAFELMTGWLNAPVFLSTVTLGSLRDMGYIIGVDYTDIYTGPAGGTVVVPDDGTANVRILEGGAGINTLAAATTTVQSLAMSAQTTAATLNMGGNTLVIGSSVRGGAIEILRDAKGLTIGSSVNDGFVTAGSSGDATLGLVNSQASSVLTVNSAIKDNAGGGAVSVSVSGDTGAKIIFRGNNTYTGTTTVHSGTLVFDAPSSVLTGSVAVEASGVLAVGNDSGPVASRLLSFVSAANSGTIDIRSDGMLTLSGATALGGGGILANHGVLGVSGTASTTNTLVAGAGSVLLLANGSARLNVGSLTVDPGAKIAVGSTIGFAPGTLNAVVHAANTASGTFTVDPALSVGLGTGLRWITRTTGQDVLLGLQYYIASLPAGATPQQRATAAGLGDAALLGAGAGLETEYTRLALLPVSELGVSLDRLSGHDRAAMDAPALNHQVARGQNLLQFAQMQLTNGETIVSRSTAEAMRATALGDLKSGDLDESYGLQFFMRAEHATESRDHQSSGALASDATGNLFTVGLHNQLTDDWNVGMAFTYDQTDIDTGRGLGKSAAETYALDLYFSHLIDESQHWFLAGAAGLGKSNYDNRRSGITPANLTATSSVSGTQFHVAGQLGYHADVWPDAMLTPYAGLSYVRNAVGSYVESLPGAPGLALAYDEHTATATEAVLGAQFAQGIRLAGGYTLTPSAGVAWHRQLGGVDNAAVSTHFSGSSGGTFDTYLTGLAKDAVEIQGAISVQFPGGLKAYLNGRHYESMGSSNGATQDSVGAGLQYDF